MIWRIIQKKWLTPIAIDHQTWRDGIAEKISPTGWAANLAIMTLDRTCWTGKDQAVFRKNDMMLGSRSMKSRVRSRKDQKVSVFHWWRIKFAARNVMSITVSEQSLRRAIIRTTTKVLQIRIFAHGINHCTITQAKDFLEEQCPQTFKATSPRPQLLKCLV